MCFRRLRAFLFKTRRSDSFQYKLWETHCYKIALGWLSCLRYLARISRPPQRWFSLFWCARLWDQFASRLSWESSLLWVVLLSMCSTASLSCVFAFVFNGPPWLPLEHRLRHQKSGTPGFGFGAARLRVSAQLRVMDWCRCSYTRVHQIVGSNGK